MQPTPPDVLLAIRRDLLPHDRVTTSSYRYEAFGLGLRSDLALPELVEASGPSSVRIRLATLSDAPRPENFDREWSRVRESVAYLGWDGVGTFRVAENEIVVDPDRNAFPERVRLFLLGAAMGVLLHQRGLLVLHGSAVSIDGAAAVFLGPKGGGKSTMAASLVGRGAHLLSDDVVAIDLSGAVPSVRPAFAQLKLWPDSLGAVGEDGSDLPRIHPEFDKRDLRVEDRFARSSVPLRGVFFLKKADELRVEPLDRASRMPALISHWYCARFGYETLASLGMSSHFLGSTRVARSVACHWLRRPASLAAIPEVAEAVESALSQERTTATCG